MFESKIYENLIRNSFWVRSLSLHIYKDKLLFITLTGCIKKTSNASYFFISLAKSLKAMTLIIIIKVSYCK